MENSSTIHPASSSRNRALLLALLALAALSPIQAQQAPKPATGDNPLLKKFDTNGDGVIDEEERRGVRGKMRQMQNKPGAMGFFKPADADGDGLVTLQEAETFMRRAEAKNGVVRKPAGDKRGADGLTKLGAPAVARGTPEELARFRSAAEYSHSQAGLALLIMRDGEVIYEQHVEGSSPERAYQIASGTKSFWGPLAMCAIEDGLFSLDERVSDTLKEWREDPRKSRITVRHLLSFSSGLDSPRRLWAERGDKAALAIGQPAVAEPGTKWTYSEVHLYAFGEFLRRRLAEKKPAGKAERPHEYLQRKILQPIGLKPARWKTEEDGEPAMGDGAVLTAREWAKFGELIRLKGGHGGRVLVPEDKLALCLRSSAANPAYGMTWWLNKASGDSAAALADTAGAGRTRSSDRVSAQGICPGRLPDLVMAAGAGQQRLLVIPSERMVIVRFANENMPAAVMAGDYAKLRLDFRDDEFFARLFGWQNPAGKASAKPGN